VLKNESVRETFFSNAEIVENKKILEDGSLYKLVLAYPKNVAPGQIVHIKCGDYPLRRPFSVAKAGDGVLWVCYDVRGKGTKWLSEQKEGTKLSLLGPVGQGYTIHANKRVLAVGGGTGIFSMLSLTAKYGANAKVALGFRTRSLVNSVEEFEKCGASVSVITDDGTSGRKGFVTELVRETLDNGGIDAVYICGPMRMMANTYAIVKEYGVPCEVSLEERMGCGVGACQACVCKFVADKTKTAADGDFIYKRVCVEGPVFPAEEVLWQ
jgi:dihydroorotate dehydrogenase electron transfer subunit